MPLRRKVRGRHEYRLCPANTEELDNRGSNMFDELMTVVQGRDCLEERYLGRD